MNELLGGSDIKMEENKNNTRIVSNIQDVLLKENLVAFWFKTMNSFTTGKFIECFMGLKIIFPMIQGYEFVNKGSIEHLIETIDYYVEGLKGRTSNMRDVIKYNKSKVTFKDLVYQLSTLLAQAFIDLDLWFKTVALSNDVDLKLSQDNFKDELTLVEKKRSCLKVLSADELLKLLSYNAIHDVYARGVRENVLQTRL